MRNMPQHKKNLREAIFFVNIGVFKQQQKKSRLFRWAGLLEKYFLHSRFFAFRCNKTGGRPHYTGESPGVVAMTTEMPKWIAAARQGDARAFGKLYETLYTDLYHFALYRLGSREEAEDAVQETALEAFRGIGDLKKPESFRSWIFTILNARCSRHITSLIRQRSETPIETLPLFLEDFSPDADDACRLREAIAALSEEDRQLVLLSVVGGFSGKEIAAILRRPPGTLRSRLHRTLKKLRAVLETEDALPPLTEEK